MNPDEPINIKGLKEIKVSVGTNLFFPYKHHESVGFWASYKIDNKDIVDLIEDRVEYHNPERMKIPGITGADGAKAAYIFEAKSKGKAIITVNQEFRGDIEESYNILVIVE